MRERRSLYIRAFFLVWQWVFLVTAVNVAITPVDDRCAVPAVSPWEKSIVTEEIVRNSTLVFNLDFWNGRLGNNFGQLRNALRCAICCRAALFIETHPFWAELPHWLDFSAHRNSSPIVTEYCTGKEGDETGYFTMGMQNHYPDCSYDEYGALQYFLFRNSLPRGCEPLDYDCDGFESALVVHIRSGDIFGPNPNYTYRQPPVAYYENIFRQRRWRRVVFVTSYEVEEELNPVWTYYRDEKNQKTLGDALVEFHMSEAIGEDLKVLMCATNLVAARSSFSWYIAQLAPLLNETYTVEEYICGGDLQAGICHIYHLDQGYFDYWDNSESMRQEMLYYNGSLTETIEFP